jgi:hypothetical protein
VRIIYQQIFYLGYCTCICMYPCIEQDYYMQLSNLHASSLLSFPGYFFFLSKQRTMRITSSSFVRFLFCTKFFFSIYIDYSISRDMHTCMLSYVYIRHCLKSASAILKSICSDVVICIYSLMTLTIFYIDKRLLL